jgi:lambda family phage portal protein
MSIIDTLKNIFIAPATARALSIQQDREIESSSYYNPGYNPYMYGNLTAGEKSPGGLSCSGMVRTFDNQQIRLNARDMMYDSPPAEAIAVRYGDTVADVGLKVKFEPQADILGISLEEAEEKAEDLNNRFHLWASSKDSDITGNDNLYQNQWIYAYWQQRDNDQFIRLFYSSDKDLISPLQVGFIDPDQLVGSGFVSSFGQQYNYEDGIIRNSVGKETGYVVQWWDGTEYKKKTIMAKGRSGRTHVLHGYHKRYAGQGRGMSRFIHALQELEQITDFSQAHIQKAVNQSTYGFYTKPSKDAPASSPVGEILNQASTAIPSSVYGANPVSAPTGATPMSFNMLDEATVRQGSVWVTTLEAGEDMSAVPNTAPSDNFDQFVNSFFSYLAASMSMPLEVVLMKFNNNYSASRATLVLFWRVVEKLRAEMASDFLNPVKEAWLSEEIAAGRISLPGWSDPRLRAAWANCRWQGAPMPNIDPLKEANAAEKRVILGQETLADGAQNNNGSSFKANTAKLNREFEAQTLPKWHSNAVVEIDEEIDDEDGGEDE